MSIKYVFGSKERLFVNTAIGCLANCSYCYLSQIYTEKNIRYSNANSIINSIDFDKQFIPGKNGTIISIGCYSECLSAENIDNTIKIIEYFSRFGNFIQLATKQHIPQSFIKRVKETCKYYGQIIIYISMSTCSRIDEFEHGTASFNERIENIQRCIENGIYTVLYIKPFIEGVTLNDLDTYIDIVKHYNVPSVVGEELSCHGRFQRAVGEGLLFAKPMPDESNTLTFALNSIGSCFGHSTEIINTLREEKR